MMDKDELAQIVAKEIVKQGVEIDNLGDNESIVLNDILPVINLVQLAECILALCDEMTKDQLTKSCLSMCEEEVKRLQKVNADLIQQLAEAREALRFARKFIENLTNGRIV